MKTKQIEKWLLLEQTGELSPRQRRKLDACPEVAAKRDELKAFCASIPAVDVEPSPWAVAKISTRLREERYSVWNFFLLRQGFGGQSNYWKPALALAACLMVVSGILNFHGEQTSSTPVAVVVAAVGEDVWNDPLEEDLSRLENLIVAISGDSLDIMEM